MSTVKLLYGTNGQALTVTLASLASSTTAARASTAIDNTTNLYEDILFQLTVKSGASGVSATGFVNVYATGTADGGTTYGEGATGTDGAVTLTAPTNVRLIGSINVVANATTYKSTPMSIAKAFDGTLPDHVVIIINNQSGAALDATEGNHVKKFQGVQRQVV